jgi:NAD(P)-dependent dehydrogenase (short-subunit alcohol dehydrogenase family)
MRALVTGGGSGVGAAIAARLGDDGHDVRVADLLPGVAGVRLAVIDALKAWQPMGRLGTADEVADAVAYLATATLVTGTILTIDGGLTAA